MESEDAMVFCQKNHQSTSFFVLEEMRKNGELCDLRINVQHRQIAAHRVILAAGIPFFRSLFTSCEEEVEIKQTAMSDLDPVALESLIRFAYNGKVNISVENVRSLLLASDFLQLGEVKDACLEFVTERLRVCDVLEVRILARSLNIGNLVENCNRFIQQNFEEFSKTNGFLSLPYPCVRDIISQDDLNVPSEETVFDAVINWVKFSVEERVDMLPELLRKIRLISLSNKYLMNRVTVKELIKVSTSCTDIIKTIQNYHLPSKMEPIPMNLEALPRHIQNKTNVYAVCSSSLQGYSVHFCDFLNGRWQILKSDNSQKGAIYYVAASRERIFVFLQKAIKTFNLKSFEWELLESTHEHIEGATIVSCGNLIYCFGSLHCSFLDKVRCFDTDQNKWLKESKMQYGRANCGIAFLEESVVVTGGSSGELLRTEVEKYSPSTEQWRRVTPMLTGRCLHGCTNMNGKIYVCGGFIANASNLAVTDTAEVYDPVADAWNFISHMKTARLSFSLVTYSNKIYAFGGENGNGEPVTGGEFYDPKFHLWKCSFNVPKGFKSAVVISYD